MTIVASGSSLGAIIHPIMLNSTLNGSGSLGFANATRANAGMVSGLLLISCLLMRTRLPPSKNIQPLGESLKKFSRDWAYIASIFGLILYSAGFYYPFFYLQVDAITHGLNPTFAFYSLVILNFSGIFGRLTPGFLAGRLGVEYMVAISSGLCSVFIFAMIGVGNVASVVLIAVFYGFFAGAFVALVGPIMAVLSDDLSELGNRMGIAFALSAIGGLVGPPIQGALLTSDLIWWRPAVFSGVTALVGFFGFVVMVILIRKRRQAATKET